MKKRNQDPISNELDILCNTVKELVSQKNYEACLSHICKAMESHPHAPQPHNLLGIVLEMMGDHLTAMKHFRAALALDPTYPPVTHNLNIYGTFFSNGSCAFDESDIISTQKNTVKAVKNDRGIERIMSQTKIEYDEYGIGHVVKRY